MIDAFVPDFEGLADSWLSQIFEIELFLPQLVQIAYIKGIGQNFPFATNDKLGHWCYDIDKFLVFVDKQLAVVRLGINLSEIVKLVCAVVELLAHFLLDWLDCWVLQSQWKLWVLPQHFNAFLKHLILSHKQFITFVDILSKSGL
jgi:hypothetical protein